MTLSRFSEYCFLTLSAIDKQDMLSAHKKKQSIIFLNNIRFADVKALVEYMYQGEVNVSQDQLPRFLAAAESLKIKGLADKSNKELHLPSQTDNITNQKSDINHVSPQKKRKVSSTPVSSSHRTVPSNFVKPTPVRRRKTAVSVPASPQMLSELIEHEDNFISVSMKSEEDICPEELPENIWTPKV